MAINSGDCAFVLISAALVFFMVPGLAFFYSGMVRRKNSINTLLSCFFICGLASLMWITFGYSLSFGNDHGGIIGGFNHLFLENVGSNIKHEYASTVPENLFAAFQMMFSIITPAIICGSLVERMKFSKLVIFIAIWLILVYYPLAHMVWGDGGFIRELGALDFAGGNVVHISSGVAGLVACILLGKRLGYGVTSYKPHNIPFVVLGGGLLWFGWFGFNAGSALTANDIAIHAFITTNTAAATALLSWMLVEKILHGKPTALGAATGAVVGLVSITPGAGYVPIWAAIITGALVSPICYLFMAKIKKKFKYDDALDAFGCHGVGGIWGGIATGLFANKTINSNVQWNGLVYGETKLFTVQLISIGISIAFSVLVSFIILYILKKLGGIRVAHKEEAQGLDISEHAEESYPSFLGLE